jgi:acyl-CoA thioesterase FadM
MNLLFRLLRIVVAALLRPRLGLLDGSQLWLRVWPNDLDLNLHMNNGRYFTIMDLGRIDLVIRTGVAGWLLRQRWLPIVGSETMHFRRALKPFQRYRLITRILCWDERWIFLEQRFETAAGDLAAQGLVKAIVIHERRTLRPREALKAMGLLRRSPPMPPAVKAWALAEEWMTDPRHPAPEVPASEVDEAEDQEMAAAIPAEPRQPAPQPAAMAAVETDPKGPRPRRFAAWRRHRA